MSLKADILAYLDLVHASDVTSVYEYLRSVDGSIVLETVVSAMQILHMNGVLARSYIQPEYRVHSDEFCYWLPEYYRGNPE